MAIRCSECGVEIEEGDKVFVCSNCGEVFCEDCIEEHIIECIKDSSYVHDARCSVCGTETSELFDCPVCNESDMCEDCLEEHIKDEHSDEYEEYDYEDYIDKKIIENV